MTVTERGEDDLMSHDECHHLPRRRQQALTILSECRLAPIHPLNPSEVAFPYPVPEIP